MRKHGNACYTAAVLSLGLTMLCTLIYGLTLSKETVSDNMITYTPYRIILSISILIQTGFWTTCMYSKWATDPETTAWGLTTIGVTVCGWVGLSTVLTGITHAVFVCVFIASFLVTVLILCSLTWQRRVVDMLMLCIAFLLVCIVVMAILYNNKEFYIMEHMALITYSLIFTFLFLSHTPDQWGALPEDQPSNEGENLTQMHTKMQSQVTQLQFERVSQRAMHYHARA
jgi:hypothetical protein